MPPLACIRITTAAMSMVTWATARIPVETQRWREAHILAAGLVIFSFVVILSMMLLDVTTLPEPVRSSTT